MLIGCDIKEDVVAEAEVPLRYVGEAEVQISAKIAAVQGWLIRPLPAKEL
jgi:hypothetical protein